MRRRQIKNFLLTLAIARGVPMLLAGDEFRCSQRGNNNAYCQDNETSWVDWSLLQRHDEIFRLACRALAFRRGHAVLRREAFYACHLLCASNVHCEEPEKRPHISGYNASIAWPRRNVC